MVIQKEYTPIVSPKDEKKKRGFSFKIFSGVTAALALSSGGYLLYSNNNSPQQGVSMQSALTRSGNGLFSGDDNAIRVAGHAKKQKMTDDCVNNAVVEAQDKFLLAIVEEAAKEYPGLYSDVTIQACSAGSIVAISLACGATTKMVGICLGCWVSTFGQCFPFTAGPCADILTSSGAACKAAINSCGSF